MGMGKGMRMLCSSGLLPRVTDLLGTGARAVRHLLLDLILGGRYDVRSPLALSMDLGLDVLMPSTPVEMAA